MLPLTPQIYHLKNVINVKTYYNIAYVHYACFCETVLFVMSGHETEVRLNCIYSPPMMYVITKTNYIMKYNKSMILHHIESMSWDLRLTNSCSVSISN